MVAYAFAAFAFQITWIRADAVLQVNLNVWAFYSHSSLHLAFSIQEARIRGFPIRRHKEGPRLQAYFNGSSWASSTLMRSQLGASRTCFCRRVWGLLGIEVGLNGQYRWVTNGRLLQPHVCHFQNHALRFIACPTLLNVRYFSSSRRVGLPLVSCFVALRAPAKFALSKASSSLKP